MLLKNSTCFELNSSTLIVTNCDSTTSTEIWCQLINQQLALLNHPPLNIVQSNTCERTNAIYLLLFNQSDDLPDDLKPLAKKWHPRMQPEGYIISVAPTRVYVLAQTTAGLYYGVLTLRQLFQYQLNRVSLPEVFIRDWPALKIRGIAEDISRGQAPTLENLKKLIRFLSECKLNTLMLYLEDMFVFFNHPHIGMQRGALTPREVHEIQQFAQQYHVEIIPIFQTLGHFENILIQPYYQHLAEFPGASTLNCASPETYSFLASLFAEIAPAFHSKYFHIGGDECWDVGKGASKLLKQEKGIEFILANHFNRVYELLKPYNKNLIIYGDMLLKFPDLLNQLPKDIIILDWEYTPSKYYPSLNTLKSSGRQIIVSPGLSNWRRLFPNYNASFINISNFIHQAKRNNLLGAVTASWGDYGGENLHELNWYGYAFTAECTWHVNSIHLNDFNFTFFKNFYGDYFFELDSIYMHLAEIGNLTRLSDFWRYPFQINHYSNPEVLKQIHPIQRSARQALQMIGTVSAKVNQNREHLEYLAYVARRGLVLARKIQYAAEIERLTQQVLSSTNGTSRYKNTIIAMCSTVIHELQRLQEQYQHLWLRINKRNNLQNILGLYHRQIYYWQDKIDQVNRNNYLDRGEIESKWISPPWVESKAIGKFQAFFFKSFELADTVKSIHIQTIGQSHLRIYCNGAFIGEQTARKSVSLIVEKQRIKLWDLSFHVKQGENCIIIEVKNYDPNQTTGLNLYGEIVRGNGEVSKILSDHTWKVTTEVPPDLENCSTPPPNSLPVCVRESHWFITKPNFNRGFLSTIEWR